MRAAQAISSFDEFLTGRGLDPAEDLRVDGLGDLIIDWFLETHPAEDLIKSKSDALLFQWGAFDTLWSGRFSYDITRQFSMVRRHGIRQCRLTLLFEPDDGLDAIESGNRWCFHPEDDIEEFRAFILDAPVTAALRGRVPAAVERTNEGV